MTDDDLPTITTTIKLCKECPQFKFFCDGPRTVYTCTQAERTITSRDDAPPPTWCPKRKSNQ